MAGVFDELVSQGSVDPKLLAEILRRESEHGMLGALSGSKRLAPFGEQLRSDALKTGAGIGDARTADDLARWKQAMEQMQNRETIQGRMMEGDLNRQNALDVAALRNRGAMERQRAKAAGTGQAGPSMSLNDQADHFITLADRAATGRNQSGFWSTGLRGHLKMFGGTDSRNLEMRLEPLRSSEALTALQELKAASKTGASGLGQVTEREIDLLMSRIASLDILQDEEQLDEALTEIEARYRSLGRKLKQAALVEKTQGRSGRYNVGPSPSDIAASFADPDANDGEYEDNYDD